MTFLLPFIERTPGTERADCQKGTVFHCLLMLTKANLSCRFIPTQSRLSFKSTGKQGKALHHWQYDSNALLLLTLNFASVFA